MKKLSALLFGVFLTLGLLNCSANSYLSTANYKSDSQDIRIFTVDNKDSKITGATIEKAFESAGFVIDGNNDMNKPFKARFGGTHFSVYRLATVHDPDLTAKLVSVSPEIGLLTPLSISIWQDREGNMNVSSLSLRGMSRMTQIPMTNKDLITLAGKMEKALRSAMPGGHFKPLGFQKVADVTKPLAVSFTTTFNIAEGATISDAKDDFEAEFEGEMEPIGFLFPGFIDVNDELQSRGIKTFDFFDTYSVCKLDVIYPISKTHPEVGAFAPCTFYLYKKKGEEEVHMGFPSVQNWITSTDIADKESLNPLIEAENLFIKTVNSISE